ncbi:MAG: 2-C-methyl-D-erythritol 4-phosphate cytidylyltransferase [Bacteroidota bacterium]
MEISILIVAGGSGKRMGSEIPKQFLEINGLPVLMHTMKKFAAFNDTANMVIVLPSAQFGQWEKLCRKHNFEIPHKIAAGGRTRFHSVRNGLALMNGKGLVAVHDAVRPLVSDAVIARCFNVAVKKGSAVPCIPVTESIREVSGAFSRPVDRSVFRIVQTPQVFRLDRMKQAYTQLYRPGFTDDATVMEYYGEPVNMVEGNTENIKITTPGDLKIAEILLSI